MSWQHPPPPSHPSHPTMRPYHSSHQYRAQWQPSPYDYDDHGYYHDQPHDHYFQGPSANEYDYAVAANMPPKVKAESSVPLLCSICPKNPKFSDISHLLTHISSKSHLANNFKLQIRSQGDEEAKEQLEDYRFWYDQNNLDALLSDRLATKDQKKRSKEKKKSISNNTRSPVKIENHADESTLDGTPIYRAPVPQMHPYKGNNRDCESVDGDEWGAKSVYDTPSARRRIPNFAAEESPARKVLDPKLKTPSKSSKTKKASSEEKIPEAAQLKGIFWPGMDLFDSATPEMRRMRNQRKDSNVMRQMKATSVEIEPAEISYFAGGEFRASRDLFGPLSDDETSVKESTPKRQRRTRKPTLSDVSVNAPRIRPSRARKTASKSPEKQLPAIVHNPAPAMALFNKPVPSLNPLAPGNDFGQSFVPNSEEEDEFRMTVGDTRKNKKRTFGVFQDAPGESPSGKTESSLEDHRFDLPNNALPPYQPNSNPISRISPTPAPKPISSRGWGKENMQATMQPQVRQPSGFVSHVYPSQVFHNPTLNSLNPLYNHAYAAGNYGYGDQQGHQNTNYNELRSYPGYAQNYYGDYKQTGSTSRPTHRQTKSEVVNNRPASIPASTSRSASASGTIRP